MVIRKFHAGFKNEDERERCTGRGAQDGLHGEPRSRSLPRWISDARLGMKIEPALFAGTAEPVHRCRDSLVTTPRPPNCTSGPT